MDGGRQFYPIQKKEKIFYSLATFRATPVSNQVKVVATLHGTSPLRDPVGRKISYFIVLMNPGFPQLACFSAPTTLPGVDRIVLEGKLADLWGSPSEINTEFNSRISHRLAYVQQVLSLRPVHQLSESRRSNRTQLLQLLGLYAHLGTFPKDYDENAAGRLCFRDEEGRRCAVGFLIERTRGRNLADRICGPDFESLDAETRQLFDEWMHEFGCTAEELAMIQPGLFPQENPPAGTGLSEAFSGLYQASLRRQSDFPDESLLAPATADEEFSTQQSTTQDKADLTFSNMFDLLKSDEDPRPMRVYLVSREYGEPVVAVTFSRTN